MDNGLPVSGLPGVFQHEKSRNPDKRSPDDGDNINCHYQRTFPGRGGGKQFEQFPLIPQNFRVTECDAHADNVAGNKGKADISQRRPGQRTQGAFQITLMLLDQCHNHTDSQQHRYGRSHKRQGDMGEHKAGSNDKTIGNQ